MSDLYTNLPFSGSNTALVTPFTPDGRLDESAFEKLVDWQIEQGTHGLIPVGTTGESPTLSHEEHDRVIELCVKQPLAGCLLSPERGQTAHKRLCVCLAMQKLLVQMRC